MKTLLILTDFSDAAFHAAEYACKMMTVLQTERIILYHAYQVFDETTSLPVAEIKESDLHKENMLALGALKEQLKPMVPSHVNIDVFAADASLPETLNDWCREQSVDLVVMGSSGKSGFTKFNGKYRHPDL